MSVARALWIEPPEDFLSQRRRLGLDKRDEMWEGVLHMVPPPSFLHNRRQGRIFSFLCDALERRGLGDVVQVTGVRARGSEHSSYRVPDISVLDRATSVIADGYIEGGLDLAVEIRSPGDETYDKIPFYASLGVHELLVVHRDTGRPELYRLAGGQYLSVASDADGWLVSERFPVAFRLAAGGLEGQDRGQPTWLVCSLGP